MSGAEVLRIGTRASALAVTQTGHVADRLGAHELVEIVSQGDRSTAPLEQLGGTGVFVTALRDALLRDEVDVIVHSFKDLPTAPHPGITVAAVPKRRDARDALVSGGGLALEALPEGARVGTGSPRRRAQLLAARPGLDVVGIRGNVDTRLGRIAPDAEDRLDAVVLALAGLERLGRVDATVVPIDLGRWPTAPAQGALAVEIRSDAPRWVAQRVAAIDHRHSRVTAEAERGVLARLEAGCAAPVGAHALVDGDLLLLSATVYALDGSARLIASHAGYLDDLDDAAADLAERVADELLAKGAADLAPLGGGRD